MRMIVRVDHLADGNALVLYEPHECNEDHRRIAQPARAVNVENNLRSRIISSDILCIATHRGGNLDEGVHILLDRCLLVKVDGFRDILHIGYDIRDSMQEIAVMRPPTPLGILISGNRSCDHLRPHEE